MLDLNGESVSQPVLIPTLISIFFFSAVFVLVSVVVPDVEPVFDSLFPHETKSIRTAKRSTKIVFFIVSPFFSQDFFAPEIN